MIVLRFYCCCALLGFCSSETPLALPHCFALVMLLLFFLFCPHVISLARCGHRVLGGARMVDVSATRSESELPNSGKFVLLSPRD